MHVGCSCSRFVHLGDFEGDARSYAEEVYSKVEQAMDPSINQAVDTELQTYMSTMPDTLSEHAQQQLRQGWLKQHYVERVAVVVDRFTNAIWSFQPAVPLDELSDEVRPSAAKLYNSVDKAAAEKIDDMIASEFLAISSTVQESVPSAVKEELRMKWLKKNYINVVTRVLDAMWTFSPMVPVETLPESERAESANMYAIVDRTAAQDRCRRRERIVQDDCEASSDDIARNASTSSELVASRELHQNCFASLKCAFADIG